MYWVSRITPCEWCPLRLAPTRLSDTIRASSSGTPAPTNRDVTNRVSSGAWNDGIAGNSGVWGDREISILRGHGTFAIRRRPRLNWRGMARVSLPDGSAQGDPQRSERPTSHG